MGDFSPDDIRLMMDNIFNIRNVCVIGNINHGKTTLTDSLVSKAGIISSSSSGETRYTDTRSDEQDSGLSLRSSIISMPYRLQKEDIEDIEQETNGNEFLVHLIDTPGHVDFSADVSTALRLTDGALLVVDCIDGVCAQTQSVLHKTLQELVKPVLCINKVDRAILEYRMSKEQLYQQFCKTIETTNSIIGMYSSIFEGYQVLPDISNVAFGSGYQCWAFTLKIFANRYAEKFGVDRNKMMERLWGDNYFDSATRTWTTKSVDADGNALERGFNMFVLDPIYKIFEVVMNIQNRNLEDLLNKLDIELGGEEQNLRDRALLKLIMRKYLPAGEALAQTFSIHLPSPATAQKYRVDDLYTGPSDDESATGIYECDQTAPLMIYVSKFAPASDKGKLYAVGRVFSGMVKTGQRVLIQGPGYEVGSKNNTVKSISRVVMMRGPSVEVIDSCPVGNIVGLIGIEQSLPSFGTVASSDKSYGIRDISMSVSPVVEKAVGVKQSQDLPKLVEGLKRLSKIDPSLSVKTLDNGEIIVSGVGELQLEVSLKDLEDTYSGVALTIPNGAVSYRETVQAESSIVALSKSPNKHNRFYAVALPLDDKIVEGFENGSIPIGHSAKTLVEEFGWDETDTQKIWTFGPDGMETNMLIESVKGKKQYFGEIQDYCCSGFQWAVKNGPLADEPMRGVRVNMVDVTLHADSIHRGGGQLIPTMRRVVYAASLLAKPTLQEPVYLVDIQCPEDALPAVYGVLQKRRGHILREEAYDGLPIYDLQVYLPVVESFGFAAEVRLVTNGTSSMPQLIMDHWHLMNGNPLDKGQLETLVSQIRSRKGLDPKIPGIENYYDKV